MTRRFGLLALTACVAGLIVAPGALAAFPGTNGKIAFAESAGTPGASYDIFAVDPNGANRVQLTATADDEYAPSYSADGEKIVFSRYPQPPNSFGQIWVMNANGTGQTQLTTGGPTADDYHPTFTPDGTKIVFERDTTAQTSIPRSGS